MKPIGHGVPQLDGIRFSAALLVMIAHGTFNSAAIPEPLLNFLWTAAGVGLSLFFTLSGFVIHYGYHDTVTVRGGVSAFAIARFARLYPLYFAVLLYEVFASGALGPMLRGIAPDKVISLFFDGTLKHSWWYGVLGQNNLIFQWGDSTAVAWSISAEIALYMLYPTLCIIAYRLKSLRANVLFVCCICLGQILFCILAVGCRSFIIDHYQMAFGSVIKDGSNSGTYDQFFQWLQNYSPYPRFGQFALGVAMANIFIRREQREVASSWCASRGITPGAVLLIALGYWVSYSFFISPLNLSSAQYQSFLNNCLIFSLFAAGLIYLAAAMPKARTIRFFGSLLMVQAGDATYASYLLHVPLLYFVNNNIASLAIAGAPPGKAVVRAIFLLLTYLFIALVSYGIFRIFEAPARRWIRRHCPPVAIMSLIALQLVLFGTGVAWVTHIQRAAIP